MASIINATTSTGLVQTADNSGSLQLQTNNGTTAVTIDTSQNTTFVKPITIGSSILGSGNASSFKNRIINGDMRIDQRNAGASVTANDGVFGVDRFKCVVSQSSKGTVQQSTTAPAGYINSLLFTSSSAYSIGANDYFNIRHNIEGLNVTDLGWGTANAQTVTLSFWVRSSLTGTFGGAFANSAYNRSYPFSYTISSANTWEQKSITVAGDTSGTWLTTNGIGLVVNFGLGVGSTWSGTAGAWASATYNAPTGATSVVGTNGATFYITGVQLEVGSSATSFDNRDFGRELILCQRYYQQSNPLVQASSLYNSEANAIYGQMYLYGASDGISSPIIFRVNMRTTPTCQFYAAQGGTKSSTPTTISVYQAGGSWVAATAQLAAPCNSTSISINITNSTGTSAGAGLNMVAWTASAEL